MRRVLAVTLPALTAAMLFSTAAHAVTPTLLIGGAATKTATIVVLAKNPMFTSESGKIFKGTNYVFVGIFETTTLGAFASAVTGAESAGVKCLSLDTATAGRINIEGVFHLVFDTNLPNAALALLIKPVHILCAAKLLVVEGCTLMLVEPTNVLVAAGNKYTVKQTQAGGLADEKEYRYEEGEAIKTCELTVKENGGAAEMLGFEFKEGTMEVEENNLPVASELMA